MTCPADRTRLSIESVNPEINMALAERTFDLPIPESAEVYHISDLRGTEDPSLSEDAEDQKTE